MELKGKKITVVGLARSGVGAANLLSEMGAEVTVTDRKSNDELAGSIKRLAPSVRLALGGHPDNIFMSADMVVVSPGVPLEINPIASAKANGISVIGELELAYQIIQGLGVRGQGLAKETTPIPNPQSPIPFLAVTGSNGKSTTTTLLDHMLRKGGFKTLIGGNIGNALTEEIHKHVSSQKSKAKQKTLSFELGTRKLIMSLSRYRASSLRP